MHSAGGDRTHDFCMTSNEDISATPCHLVTAALKNYIYKTIVLVFTIILSFYPKMKKKTKTRPPFQSAPTEKK